MDNETTVYRVNPTGYYGNDSVAATILDKIQAKIMGGTDRFVTIWANNDSGKYRIFWTMDDILLGEGIDFDLAQGQINSDFYADQVLASVYKHKDSPTI